MVDYKVVFRSDGDTTGSHALAWEPGCPALVSAVQVSRNTQNSKAYLQVKARNVSGSPIKSIGGVATVYYADDSAEQIRFEDLDADLVLNAEKPLKATELPRGDVEAVDVLLESVISSGGKWKTGDGATAVPERATLSLSEKAKNERFRKLREASIDPRCFNGSVQDHGDWWICACGQVNVGRDVCCECNSDKKLLQSNEDEAGLITSADAWAESVYRKAGELESKSDDVNALTQAAHLYQQIPGWKDASHRLDACNSAIGALKARTAQKGRKLGIIVGVIAVVVIAVALFVVNVAIPDGKYNDAVRLVEAGQYDEAVAAFQELGDYKDSKAQVVTTYAEKCAAQLAEGDNDGAMATLETLKSAGADSQTIDGIAKDAATTAMDEGNYSVAIIWYDLLGDTDGVQSAEYAYASAHQDKDDELTYRYLVDLKDASYKDAADMYSNLFDWKFEFAVCTYDAYQNQGWIDLDSWDQKYLNGRKSSTAVCLLVRATSGPPNQSKRLDKKVYKIEAKTQLHRTGDWVSWNSSDGGNVTFTVDVPSDGEIAYTDVGHDLYSEAFKVVVTDPDNGEVLYQKEIYRNE